MKNQTKNPNFDPDDLILVVAPLIHWITYIDGNAVATPSLTKLIEFYFFEN